MKKCDQFRDLILTDYIDGELDKNSAGSLEDHLLDCSECRTFFKEVKDNVTLPLGQALHQPVPSELWAAIKQNIVHEDQATDPIGDFMEKLKGLIAFPRMAPVFASLVVMFFVGSVTVSTIQLRQAQAKDQGEYLVALLASSDASAPSESNDLGTSIERYFL